jgi:serine/threonine-protein kinase
MRSGEEPAPGEDPVCKDCVHACRALASVYPGYRLRQLIRAGQSHDTFRAVLVDPTAAGTPKGNPPSILFQTVRAEDPQVLRRFLKAVTLCKDVLNHPGITRALGFTRIIQGPIRVAVAMEDFAGRDLLSDLKRKHGLYSARKAVKIGVQVCDVLDYIHLNRIVHRDLKPQTILVDDDLNVKLADFTCAKELETITLGGDLSAALDPKARFGTLPYMAPEYLAQRESDYRADIYSLAATLVHLVTGLVPYTEADEQVSATRLMDRIRSPSWYPQAPLDMPDGIWSVFKKGLAKTPSDRYQNASDMKAALEAVARVVLNR